MTYIDRVARIKKSLLLFLRKRKLELILVAPLVLYIFGFTLFPVLNAIYMSFQQKSTLHFPTLENYRYIITHFRFEDAFLNTLFITGVGLTLELTVGLFIAIILARKFRGRGIFRAIMLLPLGVPTIVSAANMTYIFAPHAGYLNEILYRLHIINMPIFWIPDSGFVTLLAIVLADMWKVTPLVWLILLAGLEAIPEDLHKAAKIDGASPWQEFRHVTLPLLKPFVTMAIITRGIDAFRIFELPLALSGKGVPVISTYVYFEYRDFDNPYASSAAATILMLMILIFAIVYLKVVGIEEE